MKILNIKLFLLSALIAPLISSIFITLFGTNFFIKKINKKTTHTIAIISIIITTFISITTLCLTLNGNIYNINLFTWINIYKFKIKLGLLIDNLTSIMMFIISIISLIVYIYSINYMKNDKGYRRFFCYLSFFTFSMLIVVMSNNLLQLFFGWELVGLISYLLIGFWFNKKANKASLKSFIINRIGDCGLIIAMGLILTYTNSLNYNIIFKKIKYINNIYLPGTNILLITIICICLFISVISKSAQFPLHVWLPDSMQGPTPVSALIHAATMVVAGIFMISRMSKIFELSNTTLSIILITGAITTTLMGILATIQYDIKKIIAYSTISQLGYMVMALGASTYPLAIFHLTTHAFFKALLFLCAGSIIKANNNIQDIRFIKNLKKYMPITWITFLISILNLVGIPFTSGFYSKESIINALSTVNIFGSKFAYYLSLFSIFITSIYSFRMYFRIFHKSKNINIINKNIKESNYIITIPLIILSIFSLIFGYFFIQIIIFKNFFIKSIFINENHKSMKYFIKTFINSFKMAINAWRTISFWLILFGISISYYTNIININITNYLKKKFYFIYKLLKNEYFINKFYKKIIVNLIIITSKKIEYFIDKKIINNLIINEIIKKIKYISNIIKSLNSGYIHKYILIIIIGIISFIFFTNFNLI